MAERSNQGWYSHVEGIDLAGKSTQMRMAREYAEANGIPYLQVREPGETELGVELRHQILTNRAHNLSARTEAFMYMADRSHTLDTIVLPALEKGITVTHDRAYNSTVAYQAAAGGVSKEAIMSMMNTMFPKRYVEPDAIAVLAISKETYRLRRAEKADTLGLDKIEERDMVYFDKVIDEFERIAIEHPSAVRVDGEMTPEEVFAVIRPLIFGPEHA